MKDQQAQIFEFPFFVPFYDKNDNSQIITK